MSRLDLLLDAFQRQKPKAPAKQKPGAAPAGKYDESKHARAGKGAGGGRYVAKGRAAPEPPREPLRLAVADDAMMRDDAQRGTMLLAAKNLGATEVRVIVTHQQSATPEGWALVERMVDDARAAGMRVHMTLATTSETRAGETPGTLTSKTITPKSAAAWMGSVAGRLRGRVSSYGVLNEPNHSRFASNPEAYGALYRAADAALRRADPQAQVMFGEMAPYTLGSNASNAAWLKRAVAKGIRTDGLAIHPYQASVRDQGVPDPLKAEKATLDPAWFAFSQMPSVLGLLRRLAANGKLRTRAGERVPVDGTEFGVGAEQSDRARVLSRAVQAAEKYGMRRLTLYHLVVQDETQAAQWDTSLLGPGAAATPASQAVSRAFSRARAAAAARAR